MTSDTSAGPPTDTSTTRPLPSVPAEVLAEVLAAVDRWGAAHAAAIVVDRSGAVIGRHPAPHGRAGHSHIGHSHMGHAHTGDAHPGDADPGARFRLASITKALFAYAVLIGVEEGTLRLDEPVPDGPPGTTVRHLLAHTSGLPFTGKRPIAAAGRRRIYSNTGFTLLGAHLERRAAMSAAEYLRLAVLEPLAMNTTSLEGSPAGHGWSTIDDMARWMAELWSPTLLAAETLAHATTAQWPEVAGFIPGVGRFRPCPWGLGFEIRGDKHPHWTGTRNDPATFGHFGGTGTFLWIDPAAGLSLCVLTDREFGAWALEAWPALSDAVLTTTLRP